MKTSNSIWLVLAALVLAGMVAYVGCKDGDCLGGKSTETATGGPAPTPLPGVTGTVGPPTPLAKVPIKIFIANASTKEEWMVEALKGAGAFVEAMEREDWLAWTPFNETVYTGPQGLKGDFWEQLQSEIRATNANGGTALYDAAAHAYRVLEERRRTQGDTFRYGIVVLSDGQDTNSKMTMVQLESLLRPSEKDTSSIQIHTIGIGSDADDAVLTKVAKAAHGRYSKVAQAADVIQVYRDTVKYF